MDMLEREAQRIRQWWGSATLDEFCQASGMDRRDASNWASNLRRRGVELKAMLPPRDNGRGRNLTDAEIDELKRVANACKEDYERTAQRRTDDERARRTREKVREASVYSREGTG